MVGGSCQTTAAKVPPRGSSGVKKRWTASLVSTSRFMWVM